MSEICCASALIRGSEKYPGIRGKVIFKQQPCGVLVTAEIYNLPHDNERNIFAFHIHQGESCSGNEKDLFADAGGHFNPDNSVHPYHEGDLPPLFGNNHGYAFMSVITDRFRLGDIIGKVLIIHRNIDDFTSQPAGNAGEKIACGEISAYNKKMWK